MPDSKPDTCKTCGSEEAPVMFCQTAEGGGSSKPSAFAKAPADGLVRGQAPSTPRNVRSEFRRMSELMFFRCTPEERRLIEFNAAVAGLEKSSYLRLQALGKPGKRAARRVRADWDELRRCMGVINKAGNVVNQLVVALRGVGANPKVANAALAELIVAARAIVEALKEI